LSRREKKAAGLEQHKKLERERPEKRRNRFRFLQNIRKGRNSCVWEVKGYTCKFYEW
jgi:hypothetical protein